MQPRLRRALFVALGLAVGCSGPRGSSGTTGSAGQVSPSDAGTCGPDNFTVQCAAGDCPANAHCRPGGAGCECNDGYADVTCAGQACFTVDGGCQAPSWWCAPREAGACGDTNFTVLCADGGAYCPSNGVCGPDDTCGCGVDYVGLTCGGADCSTLAGGCATPNWWCAPRVDGGCGPANFTVACSLSDGGLGGFCPSGSACVDAACVCGAGTRPESCSGEVCEVDSGCAYPDFWCAPG